MHSKRTWTNLHIGFLSIQNWLNLELNNRKAIVCNSNISSTLYYALIVAWIYRKLRLVCEKNFFNKHNGKSSAMKMERNLVLLGMKEMNKKSIKSSIVCRVRFIMQWHFVLVLRKRNFFLVIHCATAIRCIISHYKTITLDIGKS